MYRRWPIPWWRGERDECASHGIWRLLGCIATLKAGKVSADAEPELHDIAPGLLRVDAHGGFSQCAFRLGLPHLLEKARSQGIAAMAVNRCVHFSALWVEVEALTEAGLVALATTPSHAWVAPAGGRKPIFGTNPIAFGWPRPDGPPFVFDFATSAVARGEIQLHERAGKPIPLGWGWTSRASRPPMPAPRCEAPCLLSAGTRARPWRRWSNCSPVR